MKRIQFFADEIDMVRLMDCVESKTAIYYVPTISKSGEAETVQTYKQLSKPLGFADAQSTMACSSYLISLSPDALRPRAVQTGEGINYLYDQLVCEDTVILRPAGMYDENIILMGEVSTRVETLVSKEMMKIFTKAFKEASFAKYEGFMVGLSALNKLIKGYRLTLAVGTPFSLQIPTKPRPPS